MKSTPTHQINSETNATFVIKTNEEEMNTQMDDEGTSTCDDSAKMDDVNTGTDDSVYAPDGGWGWLVTVAGFMVAFITDGIVTSFGLLLPELLDTFEAGVSVTSLPPGILVAAFLLVGPITASLVKRWGCRPVGFCGGVVAALGVAGSAFAPSIHIFILCFGVVAGVGTGLIYLPSVTMVNVYFHRKRGVVAGIITSGSGFGLLALAPLTEMLMEHYGWRGCYLIMAAITLNFCVCASLMRPLPHPPPPQGKDREVGVDERRMGGWLSEGEDSLSLISVRELPESGSRSSPLSQSDPLQLVGQNQDVHLPHRAHAEVNTNILCLPHSAVLSDNSEHVHQAHLSDQNHHWNLWSSVKNLFLSHHVTSGDHAPPMRSDVITSRGRNVLTWNRSQGHCHSTSSLPPSHHTRVPVNVLSTWLACQVPLSLSHHTLHSQQSSDSMASQDGGWKHQKGSRMPESSLKGCVKGHHRYHSDSKIQWAHSSPSVPVADSLLKQVVNKNAGNDSGSSLIDCKASSEPIHNENTSCPLLFPDSSSSRENSVTSITVTTTTSSSRRGPCRRDQAVFILFLIGAFLIQLICYVPPLLTPSYAYQHGVSKEQVATILSIYGLVNIAGRLLAGALVYCGARALHVYNLGTLLSAGACFTFPLSSSFPTIALCLGLHGFFLGAFPPLQSVILVEYLGLDRLTSTFGTMCFVKAFSVVAGAPLAGLLFTLTGTYTVPVVVCGAVLVMAAIFHQLMDCWP